MDREAPITVIINTQYLSHTPPLLFAQPVGGRLGGLWSSYFLGEHPAHFPGAAFVFIESGTVQKRLGPFRHFCASISFLVKYNIRATGRWRFRGSLILTQARFLPLRSQPGREKGVAVPSGYVVIGVAKHRGVIRAEGVSELQPGGLDCFCCSLERCHFGDISGCVQFGIV